MEPKEAGDSKRRLSHTKFEVVLCCAALVLQFFSHFWLSHTFVVQALVLVRNVHTCNIRLNKQHGLIIS